MCVMGYVYCDLCLASSLLFSVKCVWSFFGLLCYVRCSGLCVCFLCVVTFVHVTCALWVLCCLLCVFCVRACDLSMVVFERECGCWLVTCVM